MRQQPVIVWAGSKYSPPDLLGIAKQDTQGQLKITPAPLTRKESATLFAGLLADLGVGKW